MKEVTEMAVKNTDKDSQDSSGGIKSNLPSLPDTFSEKSLLGMFESVEKEARAEVPDVDTEEGRKNIRDMARRVSASNKALDTPIRDYLRVIKAQPKILEKNARESKLRFDKLRGDILKPLSDAQSKQDKIIEWLNNIPESCGDKNCTSEAIEGYIELINGFTEDEIWPELKKKFRVSHEFALTTAELMFERAEESEKQAARLAELEAAAIKQKQADHDREIAEATANKVREEEQAKAQRDREDVDRRAAEAKQREESAKAAEAQAKRDAELAEERIVNAAMEAEANMERERVASENRQAEAVEQAKKSEAKRIADEEAEQAAQAKAREADKEHRIGINRAAMVDFIAAGISEEDAKDVIRAIAKKQIRNISIQY